MVRNRLDLDGYMRAVRLLQNFISTPAGPATRRPGTRYIATARADAVRLLPIIADGVALVAECGNGVMRFHGGVGPLLVDGHPVEVAAPYAAADWPDVDAAMHAGGMYLTHPNFPPLKLVYAPAAFPASAGLSLIFPDWRDGPYLPINASGVTITPSAVTGNITLSASVGIFGLSDIGRHLRLYGGTEINGAWGWCVITSVSSATSANATVMAELFDASATRLWRLGAWSVGTYPAAVTLHEGRLWFGRGPTIWASCSGEPENFAPTTAFGVASDAHAITATLAETPAGNVEWLSAAHGTLLAGTSTGPVGLMASTLRQPVTPSACAARRVQAAACGPVAPVKLGATVVFPSRTGRQIITLDGDWTAEGYLAPDLALFAQHLSRRGVAAMAYAQEPWSVVWCVTADGGLLSLTHARETGVTAWAQHQLGGGAAALSVAVTPAESHDVVWLLTSRQINGQTVRHVEVMAAPFEPGADADTAAGRDGMWFVDAGRSYAGSPTAELTGLDHLEGATVQVLADGAVHPDRLVAGGKITLQAAKSRIIAGLGYASRLETLDAPLQAADGVTKGRLRRASRLAVMLVDSIGGRIGVAGADLIDVAIFQPGDPMGSPPPLRSQAVEASTDAPFADDFTAIVEQSAPLPLTIAGIVPRVTTTGE